MGIIIMKKLGFGLMRLPVSNEKTKKVDMKEFQRLVDYYMSNGYNYFDTAYTYLNGNSEKAVKTAIVNKYPRKSFFLASKLPIFNLEKEDDMEKIFNEQLERCGVDYFDYYLLHNLSSKHKEKFTKIDSFSFVNKKKSEGKIRHIGISCHDSPEFLEKMLKEHPEIEFVQLQVNYLDWNDDIIESRKIYDVACKYEKPVIIMEGLKGGALKNLPLEAKEKLLEYDNTKSIVSWSFRFNLSLDNILVILSGINNMDDMIEDIELFENFTPLKKEDYKVLNQLVQIINNTSKIKCTSCNYCLDICPNLINIPFFFNLYNSQKYLEQTHSLKMYYNNFISEGNSKPSMCVKCYRCVENCPQKIDIPKELEKVVDIYESYLKIFLISRTGVLFNMSTPLKVIILSFISLILIVETPIAFGLLGACVEKSPVIGPVPLNGTF